MASENIVNLTQDNFDSEVLESKGLVVVDFWAPWCGPCKMVSPIMDELADLYKGKVKIAKLNTDDASAVSVAQRYRVMSIPTVFFFKDGQMVDRKVGAMSKENYQALIESLK